MNTETLVKHRDKRYRNQVIPFSIVFTLSYIVMKRKAAVALNLINIVMEHVPVNILVPGSDMPWQAKELKAEIAASLR